MNRRDFLAGAATGAVVAAGATYATRSGDKSSLEPGTSEAPGSAPNVAQERHEWNMVTTWPRDFPGAGTTAQYLVDKIAAMSGGRLVIKLFASGELVPAYEAFDAVREGTAHCAHDAPYCWVAKNKSIPFFCSIPGGLTVLEHSSWMQFGGGQELWDELYGDYGLRGFLAGNTGVQMGGWFQKEINSLDDFKGLKMRIPGLGAEVINRMGATAVNLPAGEIMPALGSGVIDATEWVGPWNDLAFGFYKVAKYYYGPGFHEGSTAESLMVNLAAWDTLSSDLQEIVKAACRDTNQMAPAEYLARNAETLPVLINKHGVNLKTFPDDVTKAMFNISAEVVAETANEGALNKRIYDKWFAIRKTAMDYAPLSDMGFARNRALAEA